jgi:hypothetical protein
MPITTCERCERLVPLLERWERQLHENEARLREAVRTAERLERILQEKEARIAALEQLLAQ